MNKPLIGCGAKYDEAQKEFLTALRLSPSNALAANNVGYTYAKLEQYDKAVQWFEKTLTLDPHRAIAHANLGDAYLALGRTDDACREFSMYLELQPGAKYATTIRERLQRLTP
jgi:tetratricopeptide (TPR) repeat protein